MIKLDLPQRPKPRTISDNALAALSVAVAIIAAELIIRLLHAEAIASSMLCAVIFTAWFGGFGPVLAAIVLALLAFHYYLVPSHQFIFVETRSIHSKYFGGFASDPVFRYDGRCLSASRNEGPGATFQFALPLHQEHPS
jgi:hypothetical protein